MCTLERKISYTHYIWWMCVCMHVYIYQWLVVDISCVYANDLCVSMYTCVGDYLIDGNVLVLRLICVICGIWKQFVWYTYLQMNIPYMMEKYHQRLCTYMYIIAGKDCDWCECTCDLLIIASLQVTWWRSGRSLAPLSHTKVTGDQDHEGRLYLLVPDPYLRPPSSRALPGDDLMYLEIDAPGAA